MKRWILPMLTLAAISLAASVATAHNFATYTGLNIKNVSGPASDLKVSGEVSSAVRVCERRRKVKIFALGGQNDGLVDTDRVNRNGFFRGGGDFTGASLVKVRAPKRTSAPSGHTHRCLRSNLDFEPVP